MSPGEETRWELPGITLGGRRWPGAAGRPPVVLLHGHLDHAGTWDDVAPLLAREGWTVVAPDLRGHGRSGWVAPGGAYAFMDHVADLDALLGLLGGQAHVVGHSLGGNVASFHAGARPERVLSLGLVDALGVEDGAAGAVERLRAHLEGRATPPEARVYADVGAAAARLRATHPFLTLARSNALAERGTRPVEGGVAWAWDPRHRLRNAVPYRADTHERFLRAVTCACTVVLPDRSPFARGATDALVGTLPRAAVHTVPDCGHMVPLEAPVRLAHALLSGLSVAAHGPPAP